MDPFLGTGSPATAFNHPRENDEYLGGAEEMETGMYLLLAQLILLWHKMSFNIPD